MLISYGGFYFLSLTVTFQIHKCFVLVGDGQLSTPDATGATRSDTTHGVATRLIHCGQNVKL